MTDLYRIDDGTTMGELRDAHRSQAPWCDCPYLDLTSRGFHCPACHWSAADPNEAR